MTINQTDYDSLRALQGQLSGLQQYELQRLSDLSDAQAKAERLTNTLVDALLNPAANWPAIDALQRDLTDTQTTIAQLVAAADPARTAQIADLQSQVAVMVSSLAGLPQPHPSDAMAAAVAGAA